MNPKSHLRGRETYNSHGVWYYSDTNEPTANNPRSCGHCLMPDRPDGHDACIGELEGVLNACCGHGDNKTAYVQFLDRKRIGGIEAVNYMEDMNEQEIRSENNDQQF